MKMTRDEAKLLEEIGDDGDEHFVSLKSPMLKKLVRHGFAYIMETADYDKHVYISPAGRAALQRSEQ